MQSHPVLGLESNIGRAQVGDDVETGEHGPQRIVLVRLRIAEIDQKAIAAVLCDMALVGLDRAGASLMEDAQHLAHFLGIEALGQRR